MAHSILRIHSTSLFEKSFRKLPVGIQRLAETVLTSIRYPMMTGDQDVIQLQFDKFKDLEGIEVLHLLAGTPQKLSRT